MNENLNILSIIENQFARQNWYVSLVVRSKMADVLRGDETDDEISKMLTREEEPGIYGWKWLLWKGDKLIGWRYINQNNDTIRISDYGKYMVKFVEYMR